MKKIIAIAVAAAFAAPVYAADVSVTGDVEFWWNDGAAGSSFDSGDQDVKVTASEELENGWGVSVSLEMDGNEDGLVSDSELTINTGVVSISIGDAVDPAYLQFDEKSDVAEQGGESGGSDGTETDVLHTLLLSMSPAEGVSLAVSTSTTDDDATTTTRTVTSYAAEYANSGFTLGYGVADQDDQATDVATMSLSYSNGPFYLGYEKISDDENVEGDDKTNWGAKYAYGMGNVFYETGEDKSSGGTAATETTAYGVSYAIGNLNTYVLQNSVESAANATATSTMVGVEYKF